MKFNPTKETAATETTNRAGGTAYDPETPELGLYKLTVNNLIEDTYYREDEAALTELLTAFEVCADANPAFVLKLAGYAREELYLRDVAQVLLVAAANDDRTREYVREYAPAVVQRADEPMTCMAIHDQLFGGTMPKALKKALADSIHRFDEYELAKYDSSRREYNLKDVFNRVHPKAPDAERQVLHDRIMWGELDDYPDVEPLETPSTWETVISERGNSRESWLSVRDDMGIFARIRNLRNMLAAGLTGEEAIEGLTLEWVRNAKLYPFRFYQAYKAVQQAGLSEPVVEDWLTDAIEVAAENIPEEMGDSFVAVDVSGSMTASVSGNSTLSCMEIATLFGAVLWSKGADVGAFANDFEEIRAHHETPVLELAQKIQQADVGGSTNGWKAMKHVAETGGYDRVIFLTDMQLWDSHRIPAFSRDGEHTVKDYWAQYADSVEFDPRMYLIDLQSYGELAIPEDHANVFQISGWSENVFDYVGNVEDSDEIIEEIDGFSVE